MTDLEPQSSTADRSEGVEVRAHAWASAARWAFPIALALIGLLYFGGEIGKHADDWSINLRDPVTGHAPEHLGAYFGSYQYFWRPLHLWLLFGVGTHAFENVRPVGLFCIAMHTLACWQLFRLLRLSTRTHSGAAIPALLFLLAPMHYEVAYWFSSISTAIGSAIFLGALRWAVVRVGREAPGELGARFYLGCFTLAFLTPCFYEQPSAMTAAAPAMIGAYLVARGATIGSLIHPRRSECRRIIGVTVAFGLASVVYIALMILTAPRGARGGESSFVAGPRLIERLGEVAGGVEFCLWGERARQVLWGSWEVGVRELNSGPGLSLLVALGALGLGWAVLMAVGGEATPARRCSPSAGAVARVLWVCAGMVIFLAGFVPIAMLDRQNVEMRNLYVPLIGAAFVAAQAVDWLWCVRVRSPRLFAPVLRTAVAMACAAGMLAGAVCQIGLQDALRRLWQSDVRAIEELARAVPNPPTNAVFVPVADPRRPVGSRQPLFEILRPSSFAAVWAATVMLEQKYHRADVSAVRCSPWAPSPFDDAGPLGLRWRSIPRLDDASWVEWDRIIPFVFDGQGRVRLIDTLAVERWSGTVYEHRSPLAAGATDGQVPHVPRHRLVLSPDMKSARFAGPWHWISGAAGGQAIVFAPANLRNVLQPVQWFRVEPGGESGGGPGSRAAMRAEIVDLPAAETKGAKPDTGEAGATRGARLVFRALIDWGKSDKPAPHLRAALHVIDEDDGRELGVLNLSAENAAAAVRWQTLVVPLEAGRSRRALRVEIRPDAMMPRGLTIWVTPGQIVEGLVDASRVDDQPSSAAGRGPESVRLGP